MLAEQIFDAADVLRHRLRLVRHHRGEVQRHVAALAAEPVQACLGLVIDLGGIEQRLRRDTSDVEACAAERRALLDAGDLEAQLTRTNGAGIAGGPTADDYEVECGVIAHLPRPPNLPAYKSINRREGSSRHSLTRTRKVTASRPSIRR